MNRDPIREREIAAAAASQYGVSSDRLCAFADMRAVDGPVRTENRDLIREALEEMADGRNYTVWEMLRLAAEGHHDEEALAVGHQHLGLALGAIATAYHHLQIARRELRG